MKTILAFALASTFALSTNAATSANKTGVIKTGPEPTVAGRPINQIPTKPASRKTYGASKNLNTSSATSNTTSNSGTSQTGIISNSSSSTTTPSQRNNIYTAQPIFGDQQPYSYNDRRVNTIIEKGLVRELIVQCSKEMEGIMVHDHISNVYCDSKNECHKSLSRAIDRTCAK